MVQITSAPVTSNTLLVSALGRRTTNPANFDSNRFDGLLRQSVSVSTVGVGVVCPQLPCLRPGSDRAVSVAK